MKLQIKHYGRVRSGELVFDLPKLFSQQKAELEGKNFVLVLQEMHKKPSRSQYGYYRGVMLVACHKSEMFRHFDNKDEIHEFYFAKKFLSYTKLVQLPDKKPYEDKAVRSLADISESEMSEFIERVAADMAENGIELEAPENYYNKYYEK